MATVFMDEWVRREGALLKGRGLGSTKRSADNERPAGVRTGRTQQGHQRRLQSSCADIYASFGRYTGRFDKRRVTTIDDTQQYPSTATMVKSYQRFTLKRSFGVVVAPSANIVVDRAGQLAVCGSLEDVIVWNIKRGVRVNTTRKRRWPRSHTAVPISSRAVPHTHAQAKTLRRDGSEVTCVELNPEETRVAVGYSDGVVRLWEIATATTVATFTGHKRAVTCLRFESEGALLVSGSKDTDVVVWDTVSQTGLYR